MFSTNNLLIEASSTGNLDKVKELLDNGGNVYAIGRKNNTLVHFAAMNGHLNVVQELLKRGASIHAQNSDDLTSFELANDQNQLKVVNFLLNYQDNYGKTLLYYAIINRNHKLIDLLLEKGTDVNVQDKKGNTPLHVVVMNIHLFVDENSSQFTNEISSCLSIIRKLLDKGAKINARDENGQTPFELVKRESVLEKFLLNYRDNFGNSLLHRAVYTNASDLIDFLLNELWFDVNIKNKKGNTPLHVVARHGQLDKAFR